MALPAQNDNSQTYAYITYQGRFNEGGGIVIVDVSNPADPVEVGAYETPGAPQDVAVTVNSGQVYAFIAEQGPCGPAFSRGIECQGGVRLLDISDATAPDEVTFYQTETSVRQVMVRDGYAYLAQRFCDMDRGCDGGLLVLDISNPTNPSEVGFYDTPVGSVVIAGEYAYVDGLHILDISKPAAPTEVASETGVRGQVAAVVDGYVYIVDRTGLQVVNVTEPGAPTLVAFYDPAGPAQARDVAITADYAYVADRYDGLAVIDVSNPQAPTEGGRYSFDLLERIWAVTDNYLYLGETGTGLRVIDVADPAAPTEVGRYIPAEEQQVWGIMGTQAYIATAEGLQVVDLSDLTGPEEVAIAPWPNIGNALATALVDGYAYVARYDEGWQVVDLSNPADPVELGFVSGPSGPEGVMVDGYGYYNANGQGMQVVDIADPLNLTTRGFYQAPGYVHEVAAVVNGHAYVIVEGKLHIVDVSEPDSPREIGVYGEQYTVHEAVADGGHLYLLRGLDGLQVLDVSNPARPVEVGRYLPPGPALMPTTEIEVVGNYAYLFDKSMADLRVLDLSDPTTPTEVALHEQLGQVWAVMGTPAGQTYVYLFDFDRNVHVVDLSDPATAVEVGFYDPPGWPGAMSIVDGLLYLETEAGLLLLDVSDPTSPVEIGQYDLARMGGPVRVVGGYTYIRGSRYVLHVIDLADPAGSRQVGLFANLRAGQIEAVTVADGRAYLLLQRSGTAQEPPRWVLQIIDVANPAALQEIGFYEPEDFELASVAGVQGDYLYLLDRNANLRIVDLADPVRPHEVAVYSSPGLTQAVVGLGDYIYLVGDEVGLVILRFRP
jgi:hypothetical protein